VIIGDYRHNAAMVVRPVWLTAASDYTFLSVGG